MCHRLKVSSSTVSRWNIATGEKIVRYGIAARLTALHAKTVGVKADEPVVRREGGNIVIEIPPGATVILRQATGETRILPAPGVSRIYK